MRGLLNHVEKSRGGVTWGGRAGLDRCAEGRGPAVPRRTRAERRGAAVSLKHHGARARARRLRAAAERAPTAHAPRAPFYDMDALSDDDEFARQEAQVRHRLCRKI